VNGKLYHLHDLKIDKDGNFLLVDGTETLKRAILRRLDPRPTKVIPFKRIP
jgi:hypothetical protein